MRQINSQTKVIATLGPASSTKEILYQMMEEGVDVFRVNFSHSSQAEYSRLVDIINELNLELGSNVSIMADLQGPKLRVGEIENNFINLVEDDVITFVTDKCMGTKDHIYISYQEFPQDVKAGEIILIDDGKIKLEVIETNKKDIVKAKVIYGGPLSSKKGVNLPDTKVSLPCLTDEDISNASFALDHGVDWIALSFVRKASDILDLKELIKKRNGYAGVIAKIEKPEALFEIDHIIDIADAIMVARGDLGWRIIDYTENQGNPFNKAHPPVEGTPSFLADSICYNASILAQQVGAKAIITFTHSGYTAIRVSSHRPEAQIYAFTDDYKLLHKISLIWGVRPFYLNTHNGLNKAILESIEMIKNKKRLKDGDIVVHVGSTPLSLHGKTNMVKVSRV